MSARPPFLPTAATAVLLSAVAVTPLPAQERGERCYELRVVPTKASVAPLARVAEILSGPVVFTAEPAGRPSSSDARLFYRVERPGPRPRWSPPGFTVWTKAPGGAIWLGGAAVPAPGGERAASAWLFGHERGILRGRLEVDLGLGVGGRGYGEGGNGTTIGTVTAAPIPCDPPAVVLRGRPRSR